MINASSSANPFAGEGCWGGTYAYGTRAVLWSASWEWIPPSPSWCWPRLASKPYTGSASRASLLQLLVCVNLGLTISMRKHLCLACWQLPSLRLPGRRRGWLPSDLLADLLLPLPPSSFYLGWLVGTLEPQVLFGPFFSSTLLSLLFSWLHIVP